MAKLRSSDDGCPWDIAQTPQTLIPYVIEEAHEVVYAIRSEDNQAIIEELKDLYITGNQDKVYGEAKLGDLLFILVNIVNIARWYCSSPWKALQGSNEKFIQQLSMMKTFADRSLTNSTVNELKILWQKVQNTNQ